MSSGRITATGCFDRERRHDLPAWSRLETYKAATVVGVPIAGPCVGTTGPYVGTKFPREDYVAWPCR
jgi:hypothetical protein